MKGPINREKATIQQLCGLLGGFGLKRSSKGLADMLGQAEDGSQTPRQFLMALLDAEIKGRNESRRHRNYAGAHFPPTVKGLEEFDPEELESGIASGQLRQLAEPGWLDTSGNLVFAGPPGLGKTMIALGIGLRAIDEGYTACFEKMDSLIGVLDRADVERAAGFRLKNIKKAQLLIIDEVGCAPISRNQANRFFTLASDIYERASIIAATNKEIPEWTEVMGGPILTSAILDRMLHHAKRFSFKGESCRLKHPDVFA
ncbi:MAG: ATP-binding protein [Clostridiales bacterium]|jgi:DNA replication protein DnaC|nr:ATP-binding protein [Clostridiales bacterium]